MPLSKRKKGETARRSRCPPASSTACSSRPIASCWPACRPGRSIIVPLTKEITAVGYVEFNERGQRTSRPASKGRIDKLFVNETGQMVDAGDELASLYSPELLVTVQNLLDAKRSGNAELLDERPHAAEAAGHQRRSDRRDPRRPARPTRISRSARRSAGTSSRSTSARGSMSRKARRCTTWPICRPSGFRPRSTKTTWRFCPPSRRTSRTTPMRRPLHVTATTRAFPNEAFHGKLAFIYPHVDQDTRTVTVRFELDNPGAQAAARQHGDGHAQGAAAQDRARARRGRGRIRSCTARCSTRAWCWPCPKARSSTRAARRSSIARRSPGVYEGVRVELGPRMTGPDGVPFLSGARGLKQGERSYERLVPGRCRNAAEPGRRLDLLRRQRRLEKRAASGHGPPSTPEDPDAKIKAALAKLRAADRALAEASGTAPILPDSRLGSMGVPVKVMVDGKPVFLCCSGMQEKRR